METMDFLKGALLVCKKMFGDEFENLSNEEKRAVVMKVLNDTLNQNPILMQTMGAAMQKSFAHKQQNPRCSVWSIGGLLSLKFLQCALAFHVQ